MSKDNCSQYSIFASGQGSNALALIEQGKASGRLPSLVVVTNKESNLKDICKLNNIKFIELSSLRKGIDTEFESQLLVHLKELSIDWIFLAGFMKIVSANFIQEFKSSARGEIVNIHPSLLPLYPGLGGYKKSYENKDAYYGHTIHLVSEEVDSGLIISQKKIESNLDSTLIDYIETGKKLENENYAKLLKKIIEGSFLLEVIQGI